MAKEKGGKAALAPKIEEEALKIAKPLIEKANCVLWDVCFEKEGAMWYLRVLFEGGRNGESIDSDRCEEISKPINDLFDKQKFIEQVDILEIGTPGVYRKLRKPEHFRGAVGQRVSAHVKTGGEESYKTGILEGYDDEQGLIVVNDEEIKLSKCIKVNLEPEELEEIEETEAIELEDEYNESDDINETADNSQEER